MISVCIITYNHQQFIAQALDSVLAQNLCMPMEIVIADDFSTDQTTTIAQRYVDRYPDQIRLVHPPTREKLVVDGHTTGRINFLHALHRCRGNYIALLDGDDYWTDPLKLKKQTDLLERNPELSLVFHNVACLQNDQFVRKYLDAPPEASTLDARMIYQNLIPTCSVVFRNKLPEEFPQVFYQTKFGDWPLHIYNLNHGRIAFLDETMAAYRVGSGIWSGQQLVDRLNANLAFYTLVEKLVPAKLHQHIACARAYQHLLISSEHIKAGHWQKALPALIGSLKPLCLFNACFRSVLKPIFARRFMPVRDA